MASNDTFFPKQTSINFTVKNNSTTRSIKIFNYTIGAGNTRDLLAIPEISESDIRHSLIKGELANFIRNQTVTIVSSSIDLTQYDIQQEQFQDGAGVPSTSAIGSIIYGAHHGAFAPVFDGVTTYTNTVLVGSTYTLLADTFFTDGVVINSGITLYTSGFKLYCNGTLTNNGTIHNDGYTAVGVTHGKASAVGTLGVGLAGTDGYVGNGVASSASPQYNTLSDAAAAGGNGGAGGINAGGLGSPYLKSATNGGEHILVTLMTGILFSQQAQGTGASLTLIGGGGGGGGGSSDNAGVSGGGGGGGGGVMVLIVFNLVNNGIIRCLGGAGGNASGVGGNGGGGGGGGGGLIQSISRYRSGSGTMSVTGGAGGTAIGTGVAGSPGSNGHLNAFSA